MKAYLLPSCKVRIDPRSITMGGGSWRARKADGSPFVWDMEVVEFFYEKTQRIKRPGVLDIGANTGSFSLLPKFHEGMRVHAFEPSPRALELLRSNVKLNSLEERVFIHPFALSDKDGKAILNVPRRHDGTYFDGGRSCLGTPVMFDEWEEVEVETRRLDDLDLGRIHFIKIDVEGHEKSVFLGGEKTIRENRPQIMLEYHARGASQSGYKVDDALELLWEWGYSRGQRVGRNDIWCEIKRRMT